MRSFVQTGCLIMGILCFLYYTGIVVYSGITTDFAWIWAAGGAVFLLLWKGLRYQSLHPESAVRFVTGTVLVLFLLGIVAVLFVGSLVVSGMYRKTEQNLDYVIVLGAHVEGTVPSRALQKRLDAAYQYALENPKTVLLLSGGRGSGEDITEAECMFRYLSGRGIAPERLVKEERSTSTWENLKFSAGMADITDKKVGLLSNNFHIYRATLIARKAGYLHVFGIPAHSDIGMQPHYILREVFAVAAGVMRGQI